MAQMHSEVHVLAEVLVVRITVMEDLAAVNCGNLES